MAAATRREAEIYVVSPGGRNAPGGISRMVDYFMTEWQQQGRSPSLTLIDSYGMRSKWHTLAYFLMAFFRILFDGCRGRIAALHLHTAERGSVVRKGILLLLARVLGVPTVVHMHGAEFADFYQVLPGFLRRLVTAVFRQADRCVVLGTAWRAYYVDVVGLHPDRVVIVFNAVPDPDVRPRPSQMTCELIFAGVLNDRKGLRDLLTALASDRLKHASWHLSIAGNGDESAFRRLAEESSIAEKVTFHGWLPPAKVHELLAASDVMVLPSRREGLPMVILEAMAYGLAIVSTHVGSISDAVSNNVNGILVQPNDVAALTDALATVIEAPPLRQEMGRAGRSAYVQKFRIFDANERLAGVFASVCS
jgi:glycosyltransferase involved in cell wall biosynthesis